MNPELSAVIPILYEDTHILVCRKPAGMPSQPDPSGQPDLLTTLAASRPGLSLVHRLDTPTGGAMIFGKTQKAAAALGTAVQNHETFVKTYLCVLSAPPPKPDGVWTDLLWHDARANKTYVTDKKRPGAKTAALTYRTLSQTADGHTLCLVRLHTGRTHQIRVQFASRTLPLVGDGKYGSRDKAPGLALWAYRLTVPHPNTGKPVTASCLPDITAYPWCLFRQDVYDTAITQELP